MIATFFFGLLVLLSAVLAVWSGVELRRMVYPLLGDAQTTRLEGLLALVYLGCGFTSAFMVAFFYFAFQGGAA